MIAGGVPDAFQDSAVLEFAPPENKLIKGGSRVWVIVIVIMNHLKSNELRVFSEIITSKVIFEKVEL